MAHYIILLPTIIFFFTTSYYNGQVSTYQGFFNHPILYITSGICGVTAILLISRLSINISILKSIGEHTLFIYVSHLRAYTLFKIIQVYFLKLPITESITFAISYTALAIAILLPISRYVSKKLPFLIFYPIPLKLKF